MEHRPYPSWPTVGDAFGRQVQWNRDISLARLIGFHTFGYTRKGNMPRVDVFGRQQLVPWNTWRHKTVFLNFQCLTTV
jgi:hypothetical protein